MPTINFKAVIWTVVIIILLSQITPIRAVLRRVGVVFYNGLVLPILHSPGPGQVAVLSALVALGIVIVLRFFGKI
jgi:hypothetical protein